MLEKSRLAKGWAEKQEEISESVRVIEAEGRERVFREERDVLQADHCGHRGTQTGEESPEPVSCGERPPQAERGARRARARFGDGDRSVEDSSGLSVDVRNVVEADRAHGGFRGLFFVSASKKDTVMF